MKRLALALALLAPLQAAAVEPSEILADPALEERAREISKGLRCLVCRNENIDDSNASLAKDLRLLVRERLTEGDSDEEVMDYVVDRYGEYVLLQPTLTGSNIVLYIAGPAMLLLGLGIAFVYIRGRRRQETAQQGLSPEEEARLKEIMGE
ncbi:cytochrome c-type biogenesis protein [Rhodovulum iodosum]|uniref:cytochrome c-type biogenesis protein n=1 Tax=Rhodovulum iodosum TaxID=68291 RepID=UPI003F68AA4F